MHINYVLIDYPLTIQALALNFLILFDLVIIPINSDLGSFQDLVDLKNTLNQIYRQENKKVLSIKIIFNNIKIKFTTQMTATKISSFVRKYINEEYQKVLITKKIKQQKYLNLRRKSVLWKD
ncbi:hypothetical protein [Spiroplasma endosymbiont of Polydrusus pterygomalis]|uniref:hypothetical protein n=1 Tax=Spiroplasma endosymbiont of Polydrusus pterygomalis TaxID=3139327 RepID=UPI003CCABEB0